ncbi:MAG: leucine-rich repeat protein [Clostridia bacterium]|nr:leucine-rich repeat protein [Clostridia bacterium]
MKKNNGLRDKRLLEALEYIDEKFVDEAAEQIKARPKNGAHTADGSGFHRSIRLTLALAAGLLIISAFIPLIHHIINNYLNISGFTETTADETTLSPDITSEEVTTAPAPETSSPETTADETTAEVTTEEVTTAEETTAPPEPEYDGSRGLAYSVTNNKATLVGLGTCTEKELVIASTYRGSPVTEIGYGALANHTEIESITIPEGVTKIGTLAFSGCTNLKSIYIPASVTSIAENAFDNCPALESITVAEANENYSGNGNCLFYKKTGVLFLGCKTTVIPNDGSVNTIASGAFVAIPGLRELVIPEGVTTVAKGAITGCSDLEKISLSASLSSFELGALKNCPALAEITVSDKNETYIAKDNCLIHVVNKQLVLGCKTSIIPADGSVKYVSDYSFSGSGITTIEFPEKVTEIKPYSFENCRSLESFAILNASLLSIGDYAFSGCTKLSSFTLPKYLDTIGKSAFRGCTALTELDLSSASLESIGESAFRDCTSLVSLKINRDSSWGSSSVSVSASAFEGCTALREVELNGSGRVSFWGSATFRNCVNLKTFTTNKPYSMIDNMFTGCASLESLPLSNGNEIGKGIFEGCTSLKSFTINSEVKTIGENAFKGCESLTEMIYLGKCDEWYGLTKKTGWNSGAPFTKITCSDGDVELADPGPQHNGAPGLVHVLNEDGKSATLVELGKWWWSYGCKFADTYNGVPVTHIAPNLLRGQGLAEKLTLPNRLAEIASEQFIYSYYLKEITIPATVTEIGADAFRGCVNLATVTFTGTVEQWNKIKLGENWNLGCAFTEVICLNGKATVSIPDDGNNGTPGLLYGVSNEGYAFFSGVSQDCTETDIIVSSKYKGYDVIGVRDQACHSNKRITSIVLPEGIEYIGEAAFYYCTSLKKVVLPKSLKTIEGIAFIDCTSLEEIKLNEGLLSIGEQAFAGCSSLASITIPESLEILSGDVFYRCELITSFYIPKNVTNIYYINIPNLTSVKVHPDNPKYRVYGKALIDKETKTLLQVWGQTALPNDGSIEHIGEECLNGVDGIVDLVLPEGLRSIGFGSLNSLKNLKRLHLPSTLTEIDDYYTLNYFPNLEKITVAAGNPKYYASGNCLIDKENKTVILGCKTSVIPADGSVISIGNNAFSESNITSLRIPEGIKSIGEGAFWDCRSLVSISLPDSLESISSYVFADCPALKSIKIGENVKSIGIEVFRGCTSLEEITLPKEVEYFGWGMFDGCKSLKEIVLPKGIDATGISFTSCESLVRVVLPEGIGSISNYAFYGCTALVTVEIPESVTQIHGSAFRGCTSLRYLVLPDGVNMIGENAFYNCTSLESINIPEGVTVIERQAFYNCASLKELRIPAGVTSIGYMALKGCESLTSLTFGGTVAEWNKISKGASWDADAKFSYVTCSDGKTEEKVPGTDYSDLNNVPEALRDVLLGKTKFVNTADGTEMYLNDLDKVNIYSYQSGKFSESDNAAYAVVDLDGDGALEVILTSDIPSEDQSYTDYGDKVILREYGGKVYGYVYDEDVVKNIRADGTLDYRKNGHNESFSTKSTFTFSGSACSIIVHCKYLLGGNKYYVGNTEVSLEEYNTYASRFSKDYLKWYRFDRYPLEKTE